MLIAPSSRRATTSSLPSASASASAAPRGTPRPGPLQHDASDSDQTDRVGYRSAVLRTTAPQKSVAIATTPEQNFLSDRCNMCAIEVQNVTSDEATTTTQAV